MATCSSIFAWKIPWTEEPGRLQSLGHKELDTHTLTSINTNEPQVYRDISPPSGTSLLPYRTPLDSHRALGLSSLHQTANSHWPSILHMVIYVMDVT